MMNIEKIILNEERNVSLYALTQEVGGEFPNIPKRPAVLVIPGGGYQMCSEREALPVALPYLKAGYQAFILYYSVGKNAKWPNPLDDYEEAMCLIRSNSEKWNLYPDKIAVIGFSAGGHLAASAATMAKNRPNAAILGYAVLQGETAKECEPTAPDLVSEVDNLTPPCFLFATRNDELVPVINTIRFEKALVEKNISFESHIYSYGPHGFSTSDHSVEPFETPITPRAANWLQDSIDWLREVFGDFGDGEMTKPVVKAHVNANSEEYLSVDCTVGHIMENPEGAKIFNALMAQMTKGATKEQQEQSAANAALISRMPLRTLLSYGHVPKAFVDQLDDQLGKIRNN